jgi:GPH family glycoside/pentoside/hexuronide:cation symporter
LLIALMNAAPVAVSSTVFIFFVGSVLDAEGWEGGLLILYFLAAAGTIPIWSRLAARHGERPVLLVAMAAAIATFSVVLTLDAGDVGIFAVICLLSRCRDWRRFRNSPRAFRAPHGRYCP